jgi:hypothetical protein
MPRWSTRHQKLRARILELLQQRATPFEDRSPGAVWRRRHQPLAQWAATYLPHYFDEPFAPVHRRITDAVGEAGMPTFVGAFRGAGKSALLALARPLHQLLEGRARYVIYGSQVQRLAAQNMDCVRVELERNPRVRCDYGEMETGGGVSDWTVMPLRTGRPARLEAFGTGMSPRGRRFGELRPDEFVGDDLEDAELARNPEREQHLWDWLLDEVLPALEPRRFRFTVLGTMFGPQCLLQRARELAERKDPTGRPLARLVLEPVLSDGHSVWPERFPDEELARLRAQVGLRNWLRNYTLDPDDPTRPFQARWLKTYDPPETDVRALDVVAFLDPAVSRTGCPRALVVVGADRDAGTRYVLDAWIERGTPAEMIDQVFRVDRAWQPRVIGIESNGGYALLRPLLAAQEQSRNRRLPVRYVNHSRPKDLRIEALSAAFEAGLWRFPARCPDGCPDMRGLHALQEQFLAYPDGYVDGPDAAAGCDELLPDAMRSRRRGVYKRLSRRVDFSAL